MWQEIRVALIALVTAGLGLYTVTARSVARRTREIGVRCRVRACCRARSSRLSDPCTALQYVGGSIEAIDSMKCGRTLERMGDSLLKLRVRATAPASHVSTSSRRTG
jgi:hypothetical protein